MRVRGRWAADIALGVVLAALYLAEALGNLRGEMALPWAALPFIASLLAVGGLARRWPLAALVLTATGTAVLALVGIVSTSYLVATMVGAFLAGRRMAAVRPAVLAFAGFAVAGLAYALVMAATRGRLDHQLMQWFWAVLALVFLVVFPWFGGRFLRQRAELVAAGWQRAEQLEREQRIVAERERLRERARIAEDMHDSLGHELTLIALRAAGLEVAPDLAERHRRAAGELRELAGAATERLRDIIGVLREEGRPAPTSPGRDSVADLVARAAASGMAVTLDGAVPDAVERPVYRVVQEALTNAAKHAPGAVVSVRITSDAGETTVSVVNGPPAEPVSAVGGGTGLIGLRERARQAGGALTAGPVEGGFAVTARLPHSAAPAVTAADEYAAARRSARRGLVAAVLVPVALAAGLIAIMFGFYAFSVTNSVLDRQRFDALRIGQPRAEVEELLPDMEMLDAPRMPNPPGAGCYYYRGNGALFDFRVPVYRVCVDEERLVAKDLVPKEFDGRGEAG
ncbi:sensor histidine kinase [Actinokineospora sp. NPDC004072]